MEEYDGSATSPFIVKFEDKIFERQDGADTVLLRAGYYSFVSRIRGSI